MIEINRKIQDIIKEIIAKEFEEQTLQTKINECQGRSFDSHLSAIKNQLFTTGYLALCAKVSYKKLLSIYIHKLVIFYLGKMAGARRR